MGTERFKLDSPHIAARIYYLPSDEGRQTPITSGYRGQFHIHGSDWDAAQEFIDTQICSPGETVNAYIKFASVHEIIPMSEGSVFQIREGPLVVGQGVITAIIDKSIRQSNSTRTLYKSIDGIAWCDWDPIGVNSFNEARNEYYGYLPSIFRLILNHAKRETIAEYLYKIEVDHMGLTGDYAKCLKVADKLLEQNK